MGTKKYRRTCKYGKLKRPVRTKSGRKRKCKTKRKVSSKRRSKRSRKKKHTKKRNTKRKKSRRKHNIITYTSHSPGSSMGISSDGSMRYRSSDKYGSSSVYCVIS